MTPPICSPSLSMREVQCLKVITYSALHMSWLKGGRLYVYTSGKKAPGRSFHYEIAGDFPLFYSTLSFGDDLICVLNWMGMVSFLSSPVLGTFWLKKVKRMHSEGCPF